MTHGGLCLDFIAKLIPPWTLKFMQAHRDQHGLACSQTSVLDLDLVGLGTVWPGGILVCIRNNNIRVRQSTAIS
jgi:hypothetical protein